jgi:hypothetical protein
MDELILRYLDRQATPEEEADLAGRLRASRDARRRFARLSRVHGNLGGALTELKAPAPTLADLSNELIVLGLRHRASGSPLLRTSIDARLALIENVDARAVLAAFALNQRLAALPDSTDLAVLEILYLCLALGLDAPDRKARMESLVRTLRPAWRLSPPIVRAGTPAWAPIAACVLLVVGLYVFLSTLIGASGDAVLDKLK